MKISRLLPALALALVVAVSAAPPAHATGAASHAAIQLTEKAKIEALIASVEAQPKAVFIRNGSEYSSKQAAAHLRMKWGHVRARNLTARQFIDNIASKSSMTGRKYRIRLPDGHAVDAGVFFHDELARIESGK